VKQAVRQHRPGARHRFLGGLGDEHQRAVPLILQAEQCLRRADPARHVNVVAAAMGHKSVLPVPVGLVAACIGKAGFLFHRQRVEFSTHHVSGAVAVLVDGGKPGPADLLGDLETKRAHFGREFGCGLHFLECDLRMGVDILVQRVEAWVVGFDRGLDRGLELDDIDLRLRRGEGRRAQCSGGQQDFGKLFHRNNAPCLLTARGTPSLFPGISSEPQWTMEC